MGPAEAVKASGVEGADPGLILVERSDGPAYVVSGPSTAAAARAADLADGAVGSEAIGADDCAWIRRAAGDPRRPRGVAWC